MTKELMIILGWLRLVSETNKNLEQEASEIISNRANGFVEKMIERARLIIDLAEKIASRVPALEGSEKKIGREIKKRLSEFSTEAKEAIELENAARLTNLLRGEENKAEKDNLDLLIEFIEGE